jgi:two-component system, OmpR family, sensor histidine kinase BaeS
MKHLSLYWKLTLAFILVAVTTAGLVAIAIRLSSASSLTQLIFDQQRATMQQALADYYSSNGSWKGVASYWDQLQPSSMMGPGGNGPNGRGGIMGQNGHDPHGMFGLADQQGRVVITIDQRYPVGTSLPQNVLNTGSPLTVNGQQVGVILNSNQQPGLDPNEALFLARTSQALVFASLGALLVALIMGVILARTLTLPVRDLTAAAERITRGELDQQVNVTSQDEIGRLAEAFNRMSQEVARVNLLRRRMTADIAHDLRTPLTVIAGYVESMRDGVLLPTEERLSLIYTEIERMQNLVGDLKILTQADAGELPLHPQPIAPRSILERAAAPFQQRAEKQGVRLSVDADERLPEICVDDARMMQVYRNLVSNALRYTPSGGEVHLAAQASNGHVELTVKDTGAGIPQEDLPFIFDRFYRVDKSRTDGDESGLGLAIVKALVEAHGGSVRAESQVDKGTAIYIRLKPA